MKILKFLVGFVLVVVVLVTATSVAISTLVDFDQYAPKVEAKLEEETGLDWTVKGPIKLAFFPSLKLSVANISARVNFS